MNRYSYRIVGQDVFFLEADEKSSYTFAEFVLYLANVKLPKLQDMTIEKIRIDSVTTVSYYEQSTTK